MRAFTYDLETTTLTEDEMAVFSNVVRTETHGSTRLAVSGILEAVSSPFGSAAAGYAFTQAKMIWRNPEGTG
jgi:hypothetical protein